MDCFATLAMTDLDLGGACAAMGAFEAIARMSAIAVEVVPGVAGADCENSNHVFALVFNLDT